MLTTVQIEDRLVAEVSEPHKIRLGVDRFVALTIIGHLQLALRHPASQSPTRKIVVDFIEALSKDFPPGMRESVAMGFDSAYDQPRAVKGDRG